MEKTNAAMADSKTAISLELLEKVIDAAEELTFPKASRIKTETDFTALQLNVLGKFYPFSFGSTLFILVVKVCLSL